MNCYVDSSVVLRKVLNQDNALREWSLVTKPFSSRLIRLECFRSLDRLRLMGGLTEDQAIVSLSRLHETLSQIGSIPLTEAVLKRGEEPFATPLGSLDSIHLATVIFWRELHGGDLSFATHDIELGRAARAHGFQVIGVDFKNPFR